MPAQHLDECNRVSREYFERARALTCDTAAQIEHAIRLLNESLTLRPTMTQALLLRANLLARLCDYHAAITDLTIVAQLEDDGRLGGHTHRSDAAIASPCATAKHTSKTKTSTGCATLASGKLYRSRLANIYGSRGNLFTLMNKHQEALMDFVRAADIDSDAVWRYEIARTYMRLGNISHARYYLECVLHDRNGHDLPELLRHKTLLSLGSCLLNTTRHRSGTAAALAMFEQAADIASTTAVHALLGIACYRLQNYRACFDHFTTIVEGKTAASSSCMTSSSGNASHTCDNSMCGTMNSNDRGDTNTHSRSSDSSHGPHYPGTTASSIAVTIRVYLAVCAFRLGDYAEALQYINAAILMDESNHTLLFLRACMRMQQGLLDGAAIDMDKAMERYPAHARYCYARGLLHVQQNEEDAAERAFVHAQRLWPRFYDCIVQLGVLAQRRGNVHRALDWYHMALRCGGRPDPHRMHRRCVGASNVTAQRGQTGMQLVESSSVSSLTSTHSHRGDVRPQGSSPVLCTDTHATGGVSCGVGSSRTAHAAPVDVDKTEHGGSSSSAAAGKTASEVAMSFSTASEAEREAEAEAEEEARLLEQIGLLYTDLGYHDLAIRYFARCTLLRPRCAPYWCRLGVAQLSTGNNCGALRSFAVVLDDLSVAGQPAAVSSQPDGSSSEERKAGKALLDVVLVEAMHARAVTLFRLHRYDDALEWANRAISSGTLNAALVCSLPHTRSADARQTSTNEASRLAYTEAIGVAGGEGAADASSATASYRYYAMRAEIHYALSDYDACVQDASVVINCCHPAHAAVYYVRAAAFCAMEDRRAEALTDFDTALTLRPELGQDETFCYARGVALARDRQYAASLRCFSDAIAHTTCHSSCPTSLSKPRTIYFHERAKVRQVLHDVTGAIEDFDMVLSRQPRNFNARVRRAFALKRVGRFEEAANDLLLAEKYDTSKTLAQLEPCDVYDMDYVELSPPGGEQEEDDEDDDSGAC